MKILIVDDDPVRQQLLTRLLTDLGHEPGSVSNGQEAVDAFRQGQHPDLILMDVCMPVMDGYEATRSIRQMVPDGEIVSIMFLTSLQEEKDLTLGLDCGGDDFMTLPIRREILRAKLKALERSRHLVRQAQQLERLLAGQHQRLDGELEMAQILYRNMTTASGLGEVGNLRYLSSPMALFNGDFILTARSPKGGLRLLLGDFSGHGLTGAIGASPVSEVFHTMTNRGFAISAVVDELSRKLGRLLPTGCFVACAVVDVEPHANQLKAWNGGLPDLLLRRQDGSLERFPSCSPPLGMFPLRPEDLVMQTCSMGQGDTLYLYSDGLTEAHNDAGEMYGDRLERLLERTSGPVFESILRDVQDFRDGEDVSDDLTLAEIVFPPVLSPLSAVPAQGCSGTQRMQLDLSIDSLRQGDPLNMLMAYLRDVPGLSLHQGDIFTVLSELFNNALDHGVLGLDSHLKSTPEGFSRYYDLRAERLNQVASGWVRIELSHHRTATGGELRILVEDSGAGFIPRGTELEVSQISGRGIALARELCDELRFEGCGNRVRARYSWPSLTNRPAGSIQKVQSASPKLKAVAAGRTRS